LRQLKVKRIGAQFDFIVPFDLTMIPQAQVFKRPVVVPNAKDAFSDESREVNLAICPVCEFEINVISRSCLNSDQPDEFVRRTQY
jgi:hypothetical protein